MGSACRSAPDGVCAGSHRDERGLALLRVAKSSVQPTQMHGCINAGPLEGRVRWLRFCAAFTVGCRLLYHVAVVLKGGRTVWFPKGGCVPDIMGLSGVAWVPFLL